MEEYKFIDILSKKINKCELNENEINLAIKMISDNLVPDYQISSFLTSIYINGLKDDELFYLINGIIKSGKILDFQKYGYIVDKHSTGGIGDKITLIISPIIAALGIKIAKISGRGLGITGGTIDKLNSVGIKTDFDIKESKRLLLKYNMFIMEQTNDFVPVDGILYKIRDVTATVDSIPLITSSILAKKFAIKSNHIYLDIKIGSGGFFKNIDKGINFANKCKTISNKFNRNINITLSDMSKPLGMYVGNCLEIYESIKFLNGIFMSKNLKKLIYYFLYEIMHDKGIAQNIKEAYRRIDELIKSKEPLSIFLDYAKELGCKYDLMSDEYTKARYTMDFFASKKGFFIYPDAKLIGELALKLKVGRKKKEDNIDPSAGIIFFIDEYESVNKGDILFRIQSNYEITKNLINDANNLIEIFKDRNFNERKIIMEILNDK
ncbi:MAG: thymidine phosphorylase [Mycoplasmoidaceae bacterium]